MKRTNITAHSGCEGTRDGSMEAIARGVALGADYVEVDVRRVAGLGLMLTHDVPEDTTDLVSLEQALGAVAKERRVGINCDLKEYGLAKEVIAMAQRFGLCPPRLALSGSLTPAQLLSEPAIARAARIYLNIEEALWELMGGDVNARPWDVVKAAGDLTEWIPALIRLVGESGAWALNLPPNRAYLAPHLAAFAEAGVAISAWTVNDEQQMRALMTLPNLDNLTTRCVALAMAARSEHEGGNNP